MTSNKILKIDEEAKKIIRDARDEFREQEGRKVTFSETVKKMCGIERTKHHKRIE